MIDKDQTVQNLLNHAKAQNSDVAQMLAQLKKTKKDLTVNQLINKDVSLLHLVVVLMEIPQEMILMDLTAQRSDVNILNLDVVPMVLPTKLIMMEQTVQSTDVTKLNLDVVEMK